MGEWDSGWTHTSKRYASSFKDNKALDAERRGFGALVVKTLQALGALAYENDEIISSRV